MLAALRTSFAGRPIEVEVVDVDENPDLALKYGLYVPVLMAGDEEICHYHLDTAKLTAYLAKKD
jgi:hypothetical protein